ncbi:MAG: NADH-quinone oxidoreductase subunit L [Myxococcota bacterium]|jgi:NADH-quinone oxidoreductase subunit L
MIDGATTTTLVRWIPLLPLAATVLQATMLFLARRTVRNTWVILLSISPVVLAFLFACFAFADLIDLPTGSRMQLDSLWSWVGLGVGGEAFVADLAFRFDPLSGAVCLVVLLVSLCVWLYALGFMRGDSRPDAGYQRFFVYLGFTLTSLLILVLGENLLILLAGWIGTGLGTALLTGFWYSDAGSERAAVRSIVLSVALDAVLAGGIVLLFWSLVGDGASSASLSDIEASIGMLAEKRTALPFGFDVSVATLFAAGLALAACGRSAQLPFTFAMSGISRSPAPAAAISVMSASMGIYLCCRFSFVFAHSPEVAHALAWVGGLTALVAAASALAQRDLVALLVASAASQFGLAFIAIGCGAYSAAVFQLVMTVIVSTMLILSAGSVIHALEGERDIRRMGGLNVRLVLTHLMAAMAAFSPALFLSREQAIAPAFVSEVVPGGVFLYAVALVATLLGSWAISRFLVGVFWGSIRTPLGFRGEFDDPTLIFMVPLYGLALLSVLAIAVNPAQIWGDLLPGGVEGSESLAHFLAASVAQPMPVGVEAGLRWELVGGSFLATLLGFGTTYIFYVRLPKTRMKINARLAPIQKVLEGRDVGGVLERHFGAPLIAFSNILFERRSFLLSFRTHLPVARVVAWFRGTQRRFADHGLAEVYFLAMVAGMLFMIAMVVP